jgi:hypothetical protein
MPKGKKYGGRTKGTPNKFTKTVKEALQEAFEHLQTSPEANLKTWGENNPTEFYKLAAKLIPVQTQVTGLNGNAIQITPSVNFEALPVQDLEKIEAILEKTKKD